ncbi:unnamed protein product, partial [marine sediment metagenome]
MADPDNNFVILPPHIAIIMDGNGRWAKQHGLARVTGHRAGVKSARTIIEACVKQKIQTLSLFAFSSENWRRPRAEVSALLKLFSQTLKKEIDSMHKNNICLGFIGDLSKFPKQLIKQISSAEQLTQNNTGLKLIIALNYG